MTKGTIIIGENRSGKTLKARLISRKFKEEEVTYVHIYDPKILENSFLFMNCTRDTKCVIIDDIHPLVNIDELVSLVHGLRVNIQCGESFEINPEIIIIYSHEISREDIDKLGASSRRRLDVIECKKEDLGKLIESI
jgi:hypothetical protein